MPKKFCKKCGAQLLKCFDEDDPSQPYFLCPSCDAISCNNCWEDFIFIKGGKGVPSQLRCSGCGVTIPVHYRKSAGGQKGRPKA